MHRPSSHAHTPRHAYLHPRHAYVLQVENKARFVKEYSEEEDATPMPAAKPDDYKELFDGNHDDCFRCGLRLTRKAVTARSPPPQPSPHRPNPHHRPSPHHLPSDIVRLRAGRHAHSRPPVPCGRRSCMPPSTLPTSSSPRLSASAHYSMGPKGAKRAAEAASGAAVRSALLTWIGSHPSSLCSCRTRMCSRCRIGRTSKSSSPFSTSGLPCRLHPLTLHTLTLHIPTLHPLPPHPYLPHPHLPHPHPPHPHPRTPALSRLALNFHTLTCALSPAQVAHPAARHRFCTRASLVRISTGAPLAPGPWPLVPGPWSCLPRLLPYHHRAPCTHMGTPPGTRTTWARTRTHTHTHARAWIWTCGFGRVRRCLPPTPLQVASHTYIHGRMRAYACAGTSRAMRAVFAKLPCLLRTRRRT